LKKIAQNVAQPIFGQNFAFPQPWEKMPENAGCFGDFKNLPNVNNHPTGGTSPNLVTLIVRRSAQI
jgi:hypothetical protein